MTEWQPIETAPKDGTRIAIKFISGGEYQASWRTTYGGEWHVDSYKHLPWHDQHEITHWMPLSEADHG
jgi:hypothetical protein